MNSLKARIALMSITLIILTAATIFISNWWFINQYHQKQMQSQVQYAGEFLKQYLQGRELNLLTKAEVITKDFGFRQAVASGDRPTIESMFENHAARMQADLIIIVQTNGDIVAANHPRFYVQTALAEWGNNTEIQTASHFVLNNQQLYRCFVIPIKTPLTIAYTIIGFEVTPDLLLHIEEKTGLALSFVVEEPPLLVSAKPDLWLMEKSAPPKTGLSRFQRTEHQIEALPINWQGPSEIALYIKADLRPFYAQYDQLSYTLLIIAALIVVLAVFMSTMLANRLANPLSALYSELYQRANYDHLTGVLNRPATIMRIQKALSRVVRSDQIFCIALCDIDNFKRVNDTHGHTIGDNVLKQFTLRIQSALRDYDIFGRFGGEEFLIAIELPTEEASLTFERLRETIEESPLICQRHLAISLTMSVGVCIVSPEETPPSIDTIIATADSALYKAKENGRNQVIFTRVTPKSKTKTTSMAASDK